VKRVVELHAAELAHYRKDGRGRHGVASDPLGPGAGRDGPRRWPRGRSCRTCC
jgi:hypothetical protein